LPFLGWAFTRCEARRRARTVRLETRDGSRHREPAAESEKDISRLAHDEQLLDAVPQCCVPRALAFKNRLPFRRRFQGPRGMEETLFAMDFPVHIRHVIPARMRVAAASIVAIGPATPATNTVLAAFNSVADGAGPREI
jgi:hypothetical protein